MKALTFFILFIPILVAVLIALNLLLSVSRPDAEKVSPYECGFSPLGDARQQFHVGFYLVGILFLIFDLEILFLFPFVVALHQVSLLGFWSAILFLIILTVGFVYELGKGALHFTRSTSDSTSTIPLG